MSSKKFHFICIFCMFAVGASTLVNQAQGPPSTKLKFITTIEGKSFFGEYSSPYKNWTAAGDYCKSMNMELASITTPTQANALKNAYTSDLRGYYWTAGRDAKTWRQFSWNQTAEEVPSYVPFANTTTLQPQTCLYLTYQNFMYYPHMCSTELGVLCETK